MERSEGQRVGRGDTPCPSGESGGCDDNCLVKANPRDLDSDGDGTGNACENGSVDLLDRSIFDRLRGVTSGSWACGVGPELVAVLGLLLAVRCQPKRPKR